MNPTKVITGKDTRWSYCNVWDAKSINGGTPKFSISLIIPKSDEATIRKIKAAIEAGTTKVFDTTTFTVEGKAVESYMADVDTDAAYTPDTEVIEDGAFQESTKRSAPYFDLQIDGIELLNTAM